jgi:hypothetical protein
MVAGWMRAKHSACEDELASPGYSHDWMLDWVDVGVVPDWAQKGWRHERLQID